MEEEWGQGTRPKACKWEEACRPCRTENHSLESKGCQGGQSWGAGSSLVQPWLSNLEFPLSGVSPEEPEVEAMR